MKILLLEDEKSLAASISSYLQKQKLQCDWVATLFDAEDRLLEHTYDAITIDIGLPDGNGLDLLPIIKKIDPSCAILIISAKDSLDDKLSGLDMGADDYITKPFHLAELNSRINAIIRRKKYGGRNILKFKELQIDTSSHLVLVNNKHIELTHKEFQMLLYFIVNQNRVLTREMITDHLWADINVFGTFDFIYTHIKNLRKKIENAGGTNYIRTVYGIGYKFSEI